MGRTQDDDFSFADLKGKHLLGGRKGGVPYMTLEYVLKNNGVQPSDLNLIPASNLPTWREPLPAARGLCHPL